MCFGGGRQNSALWNACSSWQPATRALGALQSSPCFTPAFFSRDGQDADQRKTKKRRNGPGGQSDSRRPFGSSKVASRYCAGALMIAAISAGKQRRSRASKLIRRAFRKACHTAVQMTPGGNHLAQMFPATPSLVRRRAISWPTSLWSPSQYTNTIDACTPVSTDRKNSSESSNSTGVVWQAKRSVTLPAAVLASTTSPDAQLVRNEKKRRSRKGWTPDPLATPHSESRTPKRKSNSIPADMRARDVVMPSMLELGRIFDSLPTEADGTVGLTSMVAAAHELNERDRKSVV